VKFDDYLNEQRKDWRYRFWEIVLWPQFAMGDVILRVRLWLTRNKPPPECDRCCFVCEVVDCLEGERIWQKYGMEQDIIHLDNNAHT
jgi:hypothetical protein